MRKYGLNSSDNRSGSRRFVFAASRQNANEFLAGMQFADRRDVGSALCPWHSYPESGSPAPLRPLTGNWFTAAYS